MKRFEADKQEIEALYNQGNSMKDIAKLYKVNSETLRDYCHRVGIKLRGAAEAMLIGQKKRRVTNNWHSNYKGGRYQKPDGYILVLFREHPNASPQGYVYEHRLVMEQKLGRLLYRDEIVHHLNGLTWDNRPENLALASRRNHDTLSIRKALQARIRELETEVS